MLSQRDTVTTSYKDDPTSVGLGCYTVDVPGPAQRFVVGGEVVNEGALKVPYFCDPAVAPLASTRAIFTSASPTAAPSPSSESAAHARLGLRGGLRAGLRPAWLGGLLGVRRE